MFVLDWLYLEHGIGIRQMTWFPEFISIIVAVSIPFMTAINKQTHIPIKYILLIGIYLAHIIIGFLLNDVNGWVILSGMRIYTKFIPIFLVMLIFTSVEEDVKKIIWLVFILSMLQFPIVVWQRFVLFATSISGDPMGGTVGHSASGVLSIYLLIIISFLVSFYFKGIISLPFFLLSLAASFIPTTLNETKITFILLPIAFIFPAMFIKAKRKTILQVILVLFIFASSFIVLRGIYNHFQQKRWGYGIETFVMTPGRLEGYSKMRIDPIKHSFSNAVKDIRFLFFGRGAGNVSEGFTKKLSGKYIKEGEFYMVGRVSFPKMIWEIGILGTFIFFMFPFFIFIDAARLCRKEGLSSAFSLGMLSFSVLFSLSMFYTFTMDSNLLIYLFFLSAGYIAKQHAFQETTVKHHSNALYDESKLGTSCFH
ncbi:uncharacterized protein TOL2_C36520 [Desulfobacula toluolica Tol2]|uniref:O-antigen polymerase n=1 Tax=Desulfobacula toluolica (strain DSM 7467 / Tol2) TaxID=651182 RepID=K0NNY7_DESTT|nr:uncharacterized protein TOL2_C36520 [Desulfobacula toluolica Tol2]